LTLSFHLCPLPATPVSSHTLDLHSSTLPPTRLLQVAVFGFCDIRRFTDATEVLQEGVMEFVNIIAHLVHTGVAHHGGAANKNIGDAFLLVWKLPKGIR
jgi:class 3 adenylate cyclase